MKKSLRFSQFFAIIAILCGCQLTHHQNSALTATSPQLTPPNPGNAAASGDSYTIPKSLVALNTLFLDAYKQRRAFVKTNTSPLIVADFDSLILYWNGLAETNRSIPDIYHALKAVAHVPFGIFLRLNAYAGDSPIPLPGPVIDNLKTYQAHIEKAATSLLEAGFSSTQLARQQAILGECEAYLTNVLPTGVTSRKELMTFTRKVAPWILKNADDAATAQLDVTHSVVMQWKRRVPPDEWRRLVVVVRGPQMPRRLNILSQYFAKVTREPSQHLGYPLESRRLIYAEFIPRNGDHLDLMATTFVDGEASEAFFGDRWRMSRDVLADGAQEHLKKLKFD